MNDNERQILNQIRQLQESIEDYVLQKVDSRWMNQKSEEQVLVDSIGMVRKAFLLCIDVDVATPRTKKGT